MGEHQLGEGRWVCSSHSVWLPGVYATKDAARMAYRLSPGDLEALWQRKAFEENGRPDGTTEYRLTVDDLREALKAKGERDG